MAEQLETDAHTVTEGETSFLTGIIESNYFLRIAGLEPILLTSDRRIYKAIGENSEEMVLRAYMPETASDDIKDIIANLTFLEEQNFPAERLAKTKDGSNVSISEGWHALITNFVKGNSIGSTTGAFHLLGETLGKLHSLDNSKANPPLPNSRLLPKRDVAYALSELTPVKEKVPHQLQSRYDFIESALSSLSNCEELPKVFIHSDCHPGNGVRTENGDIALFDWQDAGTGPAVIDLAYLLLSSDGMAPWLPQSSFKGDDPWPEERLRAIIEGYIKYHALTSQDIEKLPDALKFRSLIFGAVNFSKIVLGESKEDESLWWWKRYISSDNIANRVKKYL